MDKKLLFLSVPIIYNLVLVIMFTREFDIGWAWYYASFIVLFVDVFSIEVGGLQ